MTDSDDRIFPLDLLRGAAIIGVVVMNVVTIMTPPALAAIPALNGGVAGKLVWLAEFVLLDGKARALLALLFGASALLVIDRAEMDGADGLAAQRRRLLWLIPIGAAHWLLLWPGDILVLLAVAGFLSLRFVAFEPIDLVKTAFLFFGVQILIALMAAFLLYSGLTVADHDALLQRTTVQEIAIHRDGYGALLRSRIDALPVDAMTLALHALPETLGFMTLGMAMAKGGFFMGQWTQAQYRQTATRAYIVSGPALLALGMWSLATADSRTADMIAIGASIPFRIPMTIAHAALLIGIVDAAARGGLAGRVAAIGRVALSNYLLCTIVATTLAYGYGFGLYAHLGRPALFALAMLLAFVMLLWSPWWLACFGRGPVERLWNRLQGRR